MNSLVRTTSESTSGSLTAVSERGQHFSESNYSETRSSFKSVRTMTMSLAQSSRNLQISAEGVLSAECLLADGEHWRVSTFDLYNYLGINQGELKWGYKDFHHACEHFRSEGTKLMVRCKLADGQTKECWFNLANKLRVDNGVIVVIEYHESLSTMFSEVPWMKYKIVAEHDFSLLTSHPVMQATMHRIAQSTMEHVSTQTSSIMSLAIAQAIEVVSKSAYEHISQSLEVMVQGVGRNAQVHLSGNTPSKLHCIVDGDIMLTNKDVKDSEDSSLAKAE
ncbi:hypothetical protein BDP27DRAFT_562503 [Rhodocollybia butyracea]|uniref:Cyanovirin-N domain-containing protein n=1 Tax=Rhodocollybia butyracea TaxID=206335 RepID=A0A9P5TXX8_9AGAR|nr:hypothetical protein BDP27DRAFT_562503 [Rhodocollybia butyracea]